MQCSNEICSRDAKYEVQGVTEKVFGCTIHLPWAVRRCVVHKLTCSVKQVVEMETHGVS